MVNDLYNNNALWLWARKMSHQWMECHLNGMMDPVLHCLFAMGLFDWDGEDSCLNQTTPAIHHVTMMGCQLFKCSLEIKTKVCLVLASPVNDESLTRLP